MTRTEVVHVFAGGDWPILRVSRNKLFLGGLSDLARFLQRPLRAMH
jgi:hypothetical protein